MLIGKAIYRGMNSFSIQKYLDQKKIKKLIDDARKDNEASLDQMSENPHAWVKAIAMRSKNLSVRQEKLQSALSSSFIFILLEQRKDLQNAIKKITHSISDLKEAFTNGEETIKAAIATDLNNHEVDPSDIQEMIDNINYLAGKNNSLISKELNEKISKCITPKGIVNIGSSCFMNAALQPLLANFEFRRRIKEENYPIYNQIRCELEDILDNPNIAKSNVLFETWSQLDLESLVKRAEDLNKATSEENLKEVLPEEATFLENAFDKKNQLSIVLNDYAKYKKVMTCLREFVIKYEEDSCKPGDLKELAKRLRESFFYANLMDGKIGQQQDAAQILEFILEAIGGSLPLRSIYQPLDTTLPEDFASNKEQPCQILQVPFSQIPPCSLQNIINRYADPSIHSDKDNIWRVQDPNTEEKVTVYSWKEEQRIQGDPPQYLQIQLKRFDNTSKKIENKVDVDNLEVDLSTLFDSQDKAQVKYKIVGGVIHNGSCKGGHYKAIVEKAGKWFVCDDTAVWEDKNPQNMLSDAYVFLLRRIDPHTFP
ncbi:MAG: hypothetical protein H7A37_05475 [Chlamydiales bacterium]|nr:hypothetical protein [Chlamydiales bacterium]